MPSPIGKDVEALAGERLGVSFVCGDPNAGRAKWFADAELRQIGRSQAAVGLHAEEHGDGFVDGQAAEPVIVAAPRSECCNGQRKRGRHTSTKIAEKPDVEGALGVAGIKVDLQGGDRRIGCRGVEDRCGGGALEAGTDFAWSLNANDCDTRDPRGIENGLPAGDDRDGSPQEDSTVKRCDGCGARVETAKVFAAFPNPEGARGQRAHSAGWRREVQCIRFEAEAAEEKRDEAQRLAGERVHLGEQHKHVRNPAAGQHSGLKSGTVDVA